MNRLKKLREDRGLKQAELALMLEVSQATLSNWERGVHDIDNISLTRLGQIFGCSIDYLLGHIPDAAGDEGDQVYYRIAQDAKNLGISAHDLEMAVNFLKMAKQRDAKGQA